MKPPTQPHFDSARLQLVERPQDVAEILDFAADCVAFAYEHGYHEHGVPVPAMLEVLAREYTHIRVADLVLPMLERGYRFTL